MLSSSLVHLLLLPSYFSLLLLVFIIIHLNDIFALLVVFHTLIFLRYIIVISSVTELLSNIFVSLLLFSGSLSIFFIYYSSIPTVVRPFYKFLNINIFELNFHMFFLAFPHHICHMFYLCITFFARVHMYSEVFSFRNVRFTFWIKRHNGLFSTRS